MGYITLTIIGLSVAVLVEIIELFIPNKYLERFKAYKVIAIFLGFGLAIASLKLDYDDKQKEFQAIVSKQSETLDSLKRNLIKSNDLIGKADISIKGLNSLNKTSNSLVDSLHMQLRFQNKMNKEISNLFSSSRELILAQNNILNEQIGSLDTPQIKVQLYNDKGNNKLIIDVFNFGKYPFRNVKVRYFDYKHYQSQLKNYKAPTYMYSLKVEDCELSYEIGEISPMTSEQFIITLPNVYDIHKKPDGSESPFGKPYQTEFTIWWGRSKQENYLVRVISDDEEVWHRPTFHKIKYITRGLPINMKKFY